MESLTVLSPSFPVPIAAKITIQIMPLSSLPPAPPSIILKTAASKPGLGIAASLTPMPVQAGKTETLTVLITKSGKSVTDAKVTADVAMTEMDMGTAHPAFTMSAPGRYMAIPVFMMSGEWKITIHAKIPGQKPMTTTITTTAGY